MGLAFFRNLFRYSFPSMGRFQHTGKSVREFELDQVLLQYDDLFVACFTPLFRACGGSGADCWIFRAISVIYPPFNPILLYGYYPSIRNNIYIVGFLTNSFYLKQNYGRYPVDLRGDLKAFQKLIEIPRAAHPILARYRMESVM